MLIHEQFFIFTEQRVHITAFTVWISTVVGVPAGGFISQAAITRIRARWALRGDPGGGSFFSGGRCIPRHFMG
jgi:hypothetical protein